MAKVVGEISEISRVDPTQFEELGLTDDVLLQMLHNMLVIRRFEEKVENLYLYEAAIQGPAHLYLGEEAIAVGVCAAIGERALILSNHRGHGHALAKGIEAKRVMAELFGKDTGICRGIGGSMHACIDPSKGALWASAIVGSNVPIAAGVALAKKLRGEGDKIVATFFGDGATNTGAFHEGINLASMWKLPVIFVCENNQYAISMRADVAVTSQRIVDRAVSYGIRGVLVDGNDVTCVYSAAREASDRARKGQGPTLLECVTYRLKGHGVYDQSAYRPKEEAEPWWEREPIARLSKTVTGLGIATKRQIEEMDAEVTREIEQAVEFAKNSDYPSFDLLGEVTYSK